MNEPLDDLHAVSMQVIGKIRIWTDLIKDEIAVWQPRPYVSVPHHPHPITRRKHNI